MSGHLRISKQAKLLQDLSTDESASADTRLKALLALDRIRTRKAAKQKKKQTQEVMRPSAPKVPEPTPESAEYFQHEMRRREIVAEHDRRHCNVHYERHKTPVVGCSLCRAMSTQEEQIAFRAKITADLPPIPEPIARP